MTEISTTAWRPIAEADKGIAYIHELAGLRIGNSYPIWARDEDGRTYEAVWSDNGKKAYWWDLEGESPVDPVEFMPHPLDPRFSAALSRPIDNAGEARKSNAIEKVADLIEWLQADPDNIHFLPADDVAKLRGWLYASTTSAAPVAVKPLTCQCVNSKTDPCIVCGKGKTLVTAEWAQKMAAREGDMDPTTGSPASSQPEGDERSPIWWQDEAAAEREFTEYFVRNYPGPDTVIFDPKWHAPRLFRAAKNALLATCLSPKPAMAEVVETAMREALQNAKGLLDTPVGRRRHKDDPFYDEVVRSISAALSAAKTEER